MRLSGPLRDPLVLLYLVLVVFLAAGMVKVVSDYGVRIEDRGTAVQQKLRQIATERQESIEQEQQEAAEATLIAQEWQARAVQLTRFIQSQGLSVPKPTVSLSELPAVQPEPTEPGPVGSPGVPTPKPDPSSSELPSVVPPTPTPEVTCIPIPSPRPDFCVPVLPTPNP